MIRYRYWVSLLALLPAVVVGCSQRPAPMADVVRQLPPTVFGGDRPVTLQVPKDYDGTRSYPLVLLLHGWGADAEYVLTLTGYQILVERGEVLLAAPDGIPDDRNSPAWDATPACCAFDKSADDVGYLSALITEIEAAYQVDARRVYLVGHSNGGFMGYRMACERASQIAAVVSLAGATFASAADCSPASQVSVLQIHGDQDDIVPIDGGRLLPDVPAFPSASTTVQHWAAYNGCSAPAATHAAAVDLDSAVDGAETTRQQHPGCPAGIAVELWTIAGADHFPHFSSGTFATHTWSWLKDHPKPGPQ